MEKLTAKCSTMVHWILVSGFAVIGISCATTKPPTENVTRAENTIKQAEQVGADNYAPLEIREARKKLERSRALIEEEEYEEAKRLADQAEIDAELAEVMTLSEKSQKAVHELRESIRILQEEITRNQEAQ